MNDRQKMQGKKTKRKKGFTLTEVLLAVLILAISTSMLIVSLNSSVKTYTEIEDASAAELILSTVRTMLRDELANARDVSVTDSMIVYTDSSQNVSKTLWSSSEGLKILSDGGSERFFVPQFVTTNGMHVEYETVLYEDQVMRFSNLKILKGSELITVLESYSIRIVGTKDEI